MAIDLAGSWRFQLDRDDRGIVDNWYQRAFPDDQTITLPGSLQAQGIGDDVTLETAWVGNIVDRSIFDDPRYAPYRQPGNIKFPSWLQPEKTYAGVAWYQREIEIPADWAGQRVTLTLERTHWETTVWLDDRRIGVNDSLSVAHVYDLGVDLHAWSPSAHGACRQPYDRGRGRQCPRRLRPHPDQLERHHRAFGTGRRQPGLDAQCSGLPRPGAGHCPRQDRHLQPAGPAHQRHGPGDGHQRQHSRPPTA